MQAQCRLIPHARTACQAAIRRKIQQHAVIGLIGLLPGIAQTFLGAALCFPWQVLDKEIQHGQVTAPCVVLHAAEKVLVSS